MKSIPDFNPIDCAADWSTFFCSSNPFNDSLLSELTPFQKITLIRILRQDGLILAAETFVQEILGPKFVEQGHFDLYKCFEDSTNLTPLLFIMTSEVDDPIGKILQIASAAKFDPENIHIYSISDSDISDSMKMIEDHLKTPHWIVIENIHGSKVGLNAVATLVEQLTPESAHPEFRLWISTRPNEQFPQSLLQRSVKILDFPKDGLKGLVKRGLKSDFPRKTRIIDASPQKALLQKCIPALCLFHGVVQKRSKFKPRGWTFDYEFNDLDLQLSFTVLHDILNCPCEESQLENVIYTIGESIYGGWLSDEVDRDILRELVREFLNPEDIQSNHSKLIIDRLSRHTDTNVLGLNPSLVVIVNDNLVERNVAKLFRIQDRKDLIQVRILDKN